MFTRIERLIELAEKFTWSSSLHASFLPLTHAVACQSTADLILEVLDCEE